MATNVHCSVKTTAATIAVVIMLQAVRSNAGSSLKIKESYDEIAQKALGGQQGDRQIVMMDQHNTLNHHYKRGRGRGDIIAVTNVPVECVCMSCIR
jgi:hypothetical protein